MREHDLRAILHVNHPVAFPDPQRLQTTRQSPGLLQQLGIGRDGSEKHSAVLSGYRKALMARLCHNESPAFCAR